MSDAAGPLAGVAAARMDFLDGGSLRPAGVSDLVAASWERCRVAGVDSVRPHSGFTADIDTDSLLARSARPVLEQLGVDTAGLPLTIGLTDKAIRVIQRVDPSPTITRLADQAQYLPGFDFSEAAVGSNGAGTAFEAGQPVSLVGPEHFAESLQGFAASGAPILDPVTGRIEGVVAITSLVGDWNPLMHTLIKGAAQDIGRNLLLDRSLPQQAVFDAYLRLTARSTRLAVFGFGDALWIASPAAQQMFDAGDQLALREHAAFLLTHREHARDTLVLPSSRRLVQIRGTRIVVGSKVAGVVVIVEPAPARRGGSAQGRAARSAPRIGVAARRTGGGSPAWARARSELRAALENSTPALLVGESGVGKATLAAELFGSIQPTARSITVDAGRLTAAGPPTPGDGEPVLHIVRGIDQAGADGVERLTAYLAAVKALAGQVWVVATATGAPPGELLDHFGTAITLPPLRYRTDDLPTVTETLLRGIAPGRKVCLSPAAQRLIARYSWPGNITQLRDALVHAVRRRPIGEIGEADLPGYCQTTSRRALTPVEAIERDAIIAALQDLNGNRVAAAAHLGMSRSSLYRKLQTYGITT